MKNQEPVLVDVDGVTVDLSQRDGWYAFFAERPVASIFSNLANCLAYTKMLCPDTYPNGCPVLPEGPQRDDL